MAGNFRRNVNILGLCKSVVYSEVCAPESQEVCVSCHLYVAHIYFVNGSDRLKVLVTCQEENLKLTSIVNKLRLGKYNLLIV